MSLTNRAVHLVLVLVIGAVVYGNTLTFGFVWDDKVLLLGNESIRSADFWSIVASVPNRLDYQPVRDSLQAVIHAVFGFNPFAYHAVNVVIYLINLLAIYFFTVTLLEKTRLAKEPVSGEERGLLALFTTLLFAVHPLHAEPVSFLTSVNTLLSGTFLILSCHSFLLFLYSTGRRRFSLGALVLLCFILSLLSKPSSISLPLLLALILVFGTGRDKRRQQALLLVLVSMMVAGLAFLLFKAIATESGLVGVQSVDFGSGNLAIRLVVSVQMVVFYLAQVFGPVGLAAEYHPDFAARLAALKSGLAITFLGALLGLALWQVRRTGVYMFTLAWFVIALLPHLYLLRDQPFVADRYAYIASYGAILFVVLAVHAMFRRTLRAVVKPLFCLLILALAGMTVAQNSTWKSDRALWENAVRTSPRAWRSHQNLGFVYLEEGKVSEALACFDEVERLSGKRLGELTRARLAVDNGDFETAIALLTRVLEAETNPVASTLLADAYYALGEKTEALSLYLDARKSREPDPTGQKRHVAARLKELQDAVSVELEPSRRLARQDPGSNEALNLAIALDRSGLYDEAARTYAAIERVRPPHWALYYNMAGVYKKQGKTEQAIEYYEKSIELNPCHPDTLNNIGLLFMNTGKDGRAREAFEAAIDCDANFMSAPFNLALLHFRKGNHEQAVTGFLEAEKRFPELRNRISPYMKALGIESE